MYFKIFNLKEWTSTLEFLILRIPSFTMMQNTTVIKEKYSNYCFSKNGIATYMI